MAQDYIFDSPGGDFDWNLCSKCLEAIGREPIARGRFGSGVDAKMFLSFDPPLDATEEIAVNAIFADPDTACDAIIEAVGMSYEIRDLDEAIGDLAIQIGFPLYVTYRKSAPELDKCDIIRLTFGGRSLTNSQKNTIQNAIDGLMLGWV